jgi:hypothetical protein
MISDLEISQELDKKAMATTKGGFGYGGCYRPKYWDCYKPVYCYPVAPICPPYFPSYGGYPLNITINNTATATATSTSSVDLEGGLPA